MSGGHYDYPYHRIWELSENIKHDLEDNEISERISQEAKNRMKKLHLELQDVARRVKDLEWFMSGDTGEDDFIASMDMPRPTPLWG